jgi:hypothetical protein
MYICIHIHIYTHTYIYINIYVYSYAIIIVIYVYIYHPTLPLRPRLFGIPKNTYLADYDEYLLLNALKRSQDLGL